MAKKSKSQKRKKKVQQKRSFKNARKQQVSRKFGAIPLELKADMEQMFKGRPPAQAEKMLDGIVHGSSKWAAEPELAEFEFEPEALQAAYTAAIEADTEASPDDVLPQVIREVVTADTVPTLVNMLRSLRQRLIDDGRGEEAMEVGVLAAGLQTVPELWQEAGLLTEVAKRSLDIDDDAVESDTKVETAA